jgi:hypothetical protein
MTTAGVEGTVLLHHVEHEIEKVHVRDYILMNACAFTIHNESTNTKLKVKNLYAYFKFF